MHYSFCKHLSQLLDIPSRNRWISSNLYLHYCHCARYSYLCNVDQGRHYFCKRLRLGLRFELCDTVFKLECVGQWFAWCCFYDGVVAEGYRDLHGCGGTGNCWERCWFHGFGRIWNFATIDQQYNRE